ncbi:hypothetical protein MS3_00007729 [Schistosoma haematobium]|uniref:Uncharacterized protein n=1 Tax=Schistosoma haematobium TaxID=6185 RepID=A0A922LGZ8_SCHHA|nr:hypothetical protein MS3_00007729 [Schistosoma haematobium]KAH9583277.1 hypothetical protein MS3_00007729 [Schistosoma haematobium]
MLHSSFLIFFLFPEPTPSTTSVWFRRLQSTLAKAGLITHALVNALSRYIGFECLAYAWSRTWSLRSLLVFWLNVVSSFVCSVSGPLSPRTQSSDSGYKPLWCSMPTQAINTTHRSWYRSPKTTFVGNSTINDRFPVRQFFRPTIARQPISPTIQTAIYRKCKPFLAGAPVVTHIYHENTTGLIKTIIIITNCTSVCFNVLLFDCANDSYFVLPFLY